MSGTSSTPSQFVRVPGKESCYGCNGESIVLHRDVTSLSCGRKEEGGKEEGGEEGTKLERGTSTRSLKQMDGAALRLPPSVPSIPIIGPDHACVFLEIRTVSSQSKTGKPYQFKIKHH